MDQHMEDLFKAAQPFEMGELMLRPDYLHFQEIAVRLEDMMDNCFGGEVERLMNEYVRAHFEMERLQCLHYFHQGYLAAKAEENR